MSFFFKAFAKLFKSNSIPVFKSFFKAYKDTTSGPRASSESNSGKRHPIDDMFKSFLSKTNLAAPPVDKLTAFKILNIQPKQNQVEARQILERYYTLYKKNDPATGGTAYLQSKIFAAKEAAMSQFPNAVEAEQQFYKQVVQPQQKAEEQQKRLEKQEQQKAKKIQNQEKK